MQDAPTVKQYKQLLQLGAKLIPAQDAGKAPILGKSWWKKEVRERDVKSGKRFLLVPASLGLWALDADSIMERSTQKTIRDNVSLYELRNLIEKFPPGAISSTTRGWHLFWTVGMLADHFETHRNKKRNNPKGAACDYPAHRNTNGALWIGESEQKYVVRFDVRCCNGYVRLLTRAGVESIINCAIRSEYAPECPRMLDLADLRNEARQIEYQQHSKPAKRQQGVRGKYKAKSGGREARHRDNLNEYRTTQQARHAALLSLATSSAACGIPPEKVIEDFKPLVEARLGEPGFNTARVRDEADRVLVNAAKHGARLFDSNVFRSYGSSRPNVSDFS